MAQVNHNQRVLSLLRGRGYIAAVVEHYEAFSGHKHDLFGFIDILAVGDGETVGIQVTSRSNMASRRRKIRDAPELNELLIAGWRIELWGYDQPKGPHHPWRLSVEDIDA